MRKFLKELSSKRILFYSASQKRGRVLSSFDESVYGPLLCDITYKRLREKGILVPKLKIIPIRIQPTRIEGLESSIKEQARYFENVDIREALIEAAGMIVAYEHAASKNATCNMITWGKKVSHLKVIRASEVVCKRLEEAKVQKEDFHIVHSGVQATERANIYEKIKITNHNLLMQYRCASEGIDIPNLNIGYAARRLGVISMQQGPGGRITRATKEDRKKFKDKELSIDNPLGWLKYSATVYVLIEKAEDETFLTIFRDIMRKLQYAGLNEGDYEFNDITDERTGDTENSLDWMSELKTGVDIKKESLEDIIRQATIDLEEEEKVALIADDRERVMGMTLNEVIDFAQTLMLPEEQETK
jgi:ribosomal protein L12E/L44/L45/RPP1/RPP2